MTNFRNFDRDTGFLLPPSLNDWLPERHLARFVAEIIDALDVSAMSNSYRGSGSASYHPKLLLAVLVYGYATGVFSSRKLERATYDSVAFRFIAANEHPDHDTIAISERLPLTINVRFPGGGSSRRSLPQSARPEYRCHHRRRSHDFHEGVAWLYRLGCRARERKGLPEWPGTGHIGSAALTGTPRPAGAQDLQVFGVPNFGHRCPCHVVAAGEHTTASPDIMAPSSSVFHSSGVKFALFAILSMPLLL